MPPSVTWCPIDKPSKPTSTITTTAKCLQWQAPLRPTSPLHLTLPWLCASTCTAARAACSSLTWSCAQRKTTPFLPRHLRRLRRQQLQPKPQQKRPRANCGIAFTHYQRLWSGRQVCRLPQTSHTARIRTYRPRTPEPGPVSPQRRRKTLGATPHRCRRPSHMGQGWACNCR